MRVAPGKQVVPLARVMLAAGMIPEQVYRVWVRNQQDARVRRAISDARKQLVKMRKTLLVV